MWVRLPASMLLYLVQALVSVSRWWCLKAIKVEVLEPILLNLCREHLLVAAHHEVVRIEVLVISVVELEWLLFNFLFFFWQGLLLWFVLRWLRLAA